MEVENRPKGEQIWEFVTNTDCNLRCVYCFATDKNRKAMTEGNIDKIFDFIENYEHKMENAIIKVYGGESMIYPNLVFKIMDKTIELNEKKIYEKIRFVLVTNGTIYNEEMVDRVIRMRESMSSSGFAISFDGCEKVHAENRPFASGVESYTSVISNIRRYKEYINSITWASEKQKKNAFNVQFVFSPQIIENIDEVIKVTKAFRHEGIYTSDLLMNDESYNGLDLDLAQEAVTKLFEAFDGEGGNSYRLFSCDKAIKAGYDINSGKFCTIGRYYHSFTPDGGIYPCSHFYHNKFDSFKLGSIPDGTYNKQLAEVIYSMKRSSKCSSCETGGKCTGYCVANNIIYRKKHDSLNENVCNLNKIYVREHNLHNPIGG